MHRNRFVWISVIVAALVTAVAGAATAADTSSKDDHAEPGRLLHPAAGSRQADLRVPEDAAGVGHQHPGVLRAVLGPGPGRRQRAARRRGDPQHGQRHQRPRRQGAHQQELGQAELQRRGLELRRRLRPAQRQPEEDQGVERPRSSPASAPSPSTRSRAGSRSGTSSPPTSRSGSSARPTSRRSPTSSSSTRTTSCRRTRPGRTPRTRSSSGKGDVLLTFESEAINGKIPFVIPRQTMLIDIYIAAIEKSQNKAAVERLLALSQDVSGAEDPRRERLPPGQQAGAERVPGQVPGPRRRDEDHQPAARRLASGRQEVVRPEEQHHAADRGRRSGSPLAASTVTEAPGLPAPATQRRERASMALSLQVGFVTSFLLIVVVLPIAAVDLAVDRQRLVRVLGGRLVAAGRFGPEADDDHVDAGGADDGGVRDDHRVGARAGLLRRQVGRQRDHRPAVRPADDRRRARDHGALRPADADRLHDRLASLRRQRDVHARRDLHRAAVRHAPLRRPHRAARAHRARPGARGRGAVARAPAGSRPSDASCFRASSPGSCRVSRWRSHAPSARSARSS